MLSLVFSPSHFFTSKAIQGPHCTGKTGKTVNNGREKTGNWKRCQNIENLVAQVVNSVILKIWDIVIFATKFQIFEVSFAYEIVANFLNWHRDIFLVGQGKNRENTGNM